MEKAEITALIQDVLSGEKSVTQVVEALFEDMGRGARILVLDENLSDLDGELAELNYTTKTVEPGLSDLEIKRALRSRVFITRNGRHFSDPQDMQKFRYGLLWLVSEGDARFLAGKISQAIMKNSFKRDLIKVVKV